MKRCSLTGYCAVKFTKWCSCLRLQMLVHNSMPVICQLMVKFSLQHSMHRDSAAHRRCKSFPSNKSTLTLRFSMKYLVNQRTPSIPCSLWQITSPMSVSSPHPRCSFNNPLIITSHKSLAPIFGLSRNAGSILKAANLSFPEASGTLSSKPLTISSNLWWTHFHFHGVQEGHVWLPPLAVEMVRNHQRWELAGSDWEHVLWVYYVYYDGWPCILQCWWHWNTVPF